MSHDHTLAIRDNRIYTTNAMTQWFKDIQALIRTGIRPDDAWQDVVEANNIHQDPADWLMQDMNEWLNN